MPFINDCVSLATWVGKVLIVMFAVVGFGAFIDAMIPGPTIVKGADIPVDHECVIRIDPTLIVIIRDDHPLCAAGKDAQ